MDNVLKNVTGAQSERRSIPQELLLGSAPDGQHEQTAAEAPAADKPAQHIRVPLLKRRGNVLLMTLTTVCGAVCGALTVFSANADLAALAGSVLLQCDGSFLTLFLYRLLYGGAFLLAEYILGYFAFGEWIVWAVPLCCGMGTGLSLAAAGTGSGTILLLPSAAVTMMLTVFGANASGELSSLLLRLASGSRNNVIMTGSAAKDYTLRFLVYLAVLVGTALYEAAVKLGM